MLSGKSRNATPRTSSSRSQIPAEIEIYIDSDGTVTFADLADDMVVVARQLDPDVALECEIPALDEKKDGPH